MPGSVCWYCSLGVSSTCSRYRELPKTCQGRWSWRLAFKFQVHKSSPKTHFVVCVWSTFLQMIERKVHPFKIGGILGFLKQQFPRNCCRFWKCCSLKSAVRSGAWLRSCEGVRGACRSALSIRWMAMSRMAWRTSDFFFNTDEQKPDAPNFVVLFKHVYTCIWSDNYICENLRKIKRCLGKDQVLKGFVLDQETTPHSAWKQLLLWGVVRQLRHQSCGSRMSVLVERNRDIFAMIRPGMRIEELEQPGSLVVQARCPHSFGRSSTSTF